MILSLLDLLENSVVYNETVSGEKVNPPIETQIYAFYNATGVLINWGYREWFGFQLGLNFMKKFMFSILNLIDYALHWKAISYNIKIRVAIAEMYFTRKYKFKI